MKIGVWGKKDVSIITPSTFLNEDPEKTEGQITSRKTSPTNLKPWLEKNESQYDKLRIPAILHARRAVKYIFKVIAKFYYHFLTIIGVSEINSRI